MNCFLLCLSGLYLEIGAGYVPPPPQWLTQYTIDVGGEPTPAYIGLRSYEPHAVANPRGRLAVGHEWEPSPKFRISLELRHESWIGTTKDSGQESLWAGLRWLPWRK